MNEQRLKKLQKQIQAHNLDGIALVPGPNSFYISSMETHLSERPILLFIPAQAPPAIIIPTLEAMKASAAGITEQCIFSWTDEDGYTHAFQQAAQKLGLSNWRLGVEALHMRVLESEQLLLHAPGLQISHAEPIMSALRLFKDDNEIAAMEKAVFVAERAMDSLLPHIKIGMTEKQVAAMLTRELLALGADAIAFGPIVASGPNSASPHAMPTQRPLQNGDLLVIDWGVYVDHYPCDITRTFAVGEIASDLQDAYHVVQRANEQGKQTALPGVTCQEVDRATRKTITDAGYGEYFFHRTGHGLGLSIHEDPSLVEGNTYSLKPGNVFTIEPGIYFSGRGGMRIEDNVIVTADGNRCLTSFPRDLISVGM